jgi:hypothetical protein
MNEPMMNRLDEQDRLSVTPEELQPRAVGSPLPPGPGPTAQLPQSHGDPRRLTSVPPLPPSRSLANPAPEPPAAPASTLQRAIGLMRVALPFVQKMLPLLDGNIATTVANIINPPPPPAKPVPHQTAIDLAPIEISISELQTRHSELRDQVIEQNASLKRVEDHLELVREATDRNTLEQQELLEDLKGVGNKVNIVAIAALGLLGILVLLNLALYMHIQRVLP